MSGVALDKLIRAMLLKQPYNHPGSGERPSALRASSPIASAAISRGHSRGGGPEAIVQLLADGPVKLANHSGLRLFSLAARRRFASSARAMCSRGAHPSPVEEGSAAARAASPPRISAASRTPRRSSAAWSRRRDSLPRSRPDRQPARRCRCRICSTVSTLSGRWSGRPSRSPPPSASCSSMGKRRGRGEGDEAQPLRARAPLPRCRRPVAACRLTMASEAGSMRGRGFDPIPPHSANMRGGAASDPGSA